MPDRDGAMTMSEISDAWKKDKQRIAELEAVNKRLQEERLEFATAQVELEAELDKKCVWKPIDGMRKFTTSCGTQSNTAYATRYCHNCGGRVENDDEL